MTIYDRFATLLYIFRDNSCRLFKAALAMPGWSKKEGVGEVPVSNESAKASNNLSFTLISSELGKVCAVPYSAI